MTSFSRLLTPLGRHHKAAVASICTVLFASSSSPNTAHAFSHQQHHVVVSATGTGASHSSPLPSVLSLPRREYGLSFRLNQRPSYCHGSSCLLSNPKDYDIDLTAADEEAPVETNAEEAPQSTTTTTSSSLQNDIRSIITLVGAQSLLIPISVGIAKFMNLPNNGLGVGFEWTSAAAVQGLRWTVPLFAIAAIMQFIEPYSEALQGVTEATQRSVLAVMGKKRRLGYALVVSMLLGAVAGWGEEWLFRGVFQTLLSERFSSNIALAISGIVFGLLHAVTPVYALLAGLASVFFGYLYNVSGNLAVPMICHAVYDVGALLWAHWSVTGLSAKEQDAIMSSGPGAPIMDASAVNKE